MRKNRKSYFEFLCHEYLSFRFAVFTIMFLSFFSTKVSYCLSITFFVDVLSTFLWFFYGNTLFELSGGITFLKNPKKTYCKTRVATRSGFPDFQDFVRIWKIGQDNQEKRLIFVESQEKVRIFQMFDIKMLCLVDFYVKSQILAYKFDILHVRAPFSNPSLNKYLETFMWHSLWQLQLEFKQL